MAGSEGRELPPTRIAEPPGIHLAHISHTNDPHDEALLEVFRHIHG